MLRVKMDAAAGRKKKGGGMTAEERDGVIEGKVKDTMVLEKLVSRVCVGVDCRVELTYNALITVHHQSHRR